MTVPSANVASNSDEVSVDRISNLPSDITDRILECLPLKDTVKTSVLSKHWRYKWAYVPQVILEPLFFRNLLGLYICACGVLDCYCGNTPEGECVDLPYETYRCLKVVSNILSRHVGPIHKFSVQVPDQLSDELDITPWLHFVSSKYVKDLNCEFGLIENVYSCIFSSVGFNHLTHLRINDCSFTFLPTMCGGFPFLVSLELVLSGKSTGVIDKLGILISRCPLLEILRLDIVEEESCLRIHAPRLRNMFISGRISSICLEETKYINTLSLDVLLEQKMDTVMEFLTRLPHVERLSLCFEFWSSKGFKEVGPSKMLKPSSVLTQLKYFALRTWEIHEFPFSFTFSLFKMAPQLRELEIRSTYYLAPPQKNWMIKEDSCLRNLKSAKFECYGLSRFMLPLIKWILSSSPVLEVMTIEGDKLSLIEKKCITADDLIGYQ